MFVLDKVFLVKAMRYVQYSEKKMLHKELDLFYIRYINGRGNEGVREGRREKMNENEHEQSLFFLLLWYNTGL